MDRLSDIAPPTVSALGASVGDGRLRRLASDGHLYFDHSSGWRLVDSADVSSWPVMIANYQGTNTATAAQYINGQQFTTLSVQKATDTHSAWDNSSSTFTVPQSGTYQVEMKVRPLDSLAASVSYGVGFDTVNQDSPAFAWGVTSTASVRRNGLLNNRVLALTAGQTLKLFTYVDQNASIGIYSAEIAVYRIR